MPVDVKVVSWNVCWGCMESSKKSQGDKTAYALAVKCYEQKREKKTNICLNNVVGMLSNFDFDIAGIQESAGWDKIYKQLKTLRKTPLSYCNLQIKHVSITTFYDSAKFLIEGVSYGNISPPDIRPYMIIFFKVIDSNEYFICINLHNGHMIDSVYLENVINTTKTGFLNTGSTKNLNIESHDETLKVNEIPVSPVSMSGIYKRYKDKSCISLGDYNDNNKYNYWNKGLTLLDKHLSTQGARPPNTCCTPASKSELSWIGSVSIVYNPNIRSKILGVDVKNIIFNVATFASTDCIRNSSNALKSKTLCAKYKVLKQKCKSKKYKTHKVFSGIDNFAYEGKMIRESLRKEHLSRKKACSKFPFIRYNEVLILFYPWEVIGIEIGGRKPAIAKHFLDTLNFHRKQYITDYKHILNTDDELRQMLGAINNADNTTELMYSRYLLWNYFKEFKCVTHKSVNVEDLEHTMRLIIAELESQVNFFEYGRFSKNETFQLRRACVYNNLPYRRTQFELFQQNATPDFLTHIIPTDLDFTENYLPANALSHEQNETNEPNNLDEFTKGTTNFPLALRSVILDKDTYNNVLVENSMTEIFYGRINNNKITLVANPATFITPGVNVVLSSQLFGRKYLKNPLINYGTSYKEYGKSFDIGIRTKKFHNEIAIGDYIMIDNGSKYIVENQVPKQFNVSKLSSDHVPIEAVIQINSGIQAKQGKQAKQQTRKNGRNVKSNYNSCGQKTRRILT